MDYIAHFQVRSWGIAEFWADEFKKANARSQKAQAKLTKANRLWSKLPRQMKSIEESWKSLEGTGTKLMRVEVQEEALKGKLKKETDSAKTLQNEDELKMLKALSGAG
ncbi:hypothetical protein JHK82_050397 [Glycine max]|nr:hypothetical protein JHK82_050397 [Glycine max]